MRNTDSRTDKRKLGDLGENLACEYLRRRGFEVVDRNYLRKWGEIDIVAKKGELIHFIEVKSVSRSLNSVSDETDTYRAEDNMHPWKVRRLSRAIQTYLLEKNIDTDWQLDLITVKIDQKLRKGRVELLENIVI